MTLLKGKTHSSTQTFMPVFFEGRGLVVFWRMGDLPLTGLDKTLSTVHGQSNLIKQQ